MVNEPTILIYNYESDIEKNIALPFATNHIFG